MFVVTEDDAAAIRAVYEQRGEFAAAVELRRRFPGITDNAQARECARTIAGWKPLPLRPVKRTLPPLSRQSISLPVLKVRHRLLVHLDRLLGARIAHDAGVALLHREGTEPTQLDALATRQSGGAPSLSPTNYYRIARTRDCTAPSRIAVRLAVIFAAFTSASVHEARARECFEVSARLVLITFFHCRTGQQPRLQPMPNVRLPRLMRSHAFRG